MTFNEAKQLLKSKNMYFIKENTAFGSYEEYIAKLNDLWAEKFETEGEDDLTLDELLLNPDFEEVAKNCYESETDPSEAVETIASMFDNDADIENTEDFEADGTDAEIDYADPDLNAGVEDRDDLEDPDAEFELDASFDEAVKFLKSKGYQINESADILNEAWYNDIGLSAADETFVQRTMETYASAKSKKKNGIKGGYMTPVKRASYYSKFEHILELIADRPNATRNMRKIRNEMALLEDENWYQFIHQNNPDLPTDEIPAMFGHAAIGAQAQETAEERAARRREEEARAAREAAAEAERREREERERRERERRENPEAEDLVSRREFEEGGDEITTRPVTRRRMRTVNRDFTDHYAIPAATIKVNIDTTNDPDTLHEAEELVNTIKEKLRIQFEDDEGKWAMCNVDAAEVDVEVDGFQRKEYHVVIKMPAEIKEEMAQFVKNEMEDAFTFVNSEHPEDSVYEFDNTGNRDEVEQEEYQYDEPVVQRRRVRPQTTAVRRVNRTPRWRVHYTLATEDGADSGIQRTVIVNAATAEDAKNKVENPEDIDNAYATGVFAVTGVDRI